MGSQQVWLDNMFPVQYHSEEELTVVQEDENSIYHGLDVNVSEDSPEHRPRFVSQDGMKTAESSTPPMGPPSGNMGTQSTCVLSNWCRDFYENQSDQLNGENIYNVTGPEPSSYFPPDWSNCTEIDHAPSVVSPNPMQSSDLGFAVKLDRGNVIDPERNMASPPDRNEATSSHEENRDQNGPVPPGMQSAFDINTLKSLSPLNGGRKKSRTEKMETQLVRGAGGACSVCRASKKKVRGKLSSL